MEIAEQNSCLRAGNNQDDEDQEKEAKHVIHLMRPAEEHLHAPLGPKHQSSNQLISAYDFRSYQMLLRMKKS